MTTLDGIPLWGVFLLTVAVILLALLLGREFGIWLRRRGRSTNGVSGAMIGATMGLLAFMLAFTFNSAAGRHDARKSLVIEEANAIGTTWMRADFLAESERVEMRQLLREYVEVRVKAASEEIDLAVAMSQTSALQARMWTLAARLAQAQPESVTSGLFVESLNDMIDLHLKRVTVGARSRIPTPIWLALAALTLVAMGMIGTQIGLDDQRRSGIELALAMSFAIVLFLVADLDRPQQGLLNVSQQALIELQTRFDSKP